jgi:hypothetical protein
MSKLSINIAGIQAKCQKNAHRAGFFLEVEPPFGKFGLPKI